MSLQWCLSYMPIIVHFVHYLVGYYYYYIAFINFKQICLASDSSVCWKKKFAWKTLVSLLKAYRLSYYIVISCLIIKICICIIMDYFTSWRCPTRVLTGWCGVRVSRCRICLSLDPEDTESPLQASAPTLAVCPSSTESLFEATVSHTWT